MSRRCKICGKRLYKTLGSIGPECLNKLAGKSKKTLKVLKFRRSFDEFEVEEIKREIEEKLKDE